MEQHFIFHLRICNHHMVNLDSLPQSGNEKFVRELEKINSPLAPEWTKKIPLLGKKIRSVSKGQSVSFGFGTVAITRRGLKKLSDLERPDYVEVKSMNLKTIRKSDTNESNLTASNLLHDVTSIIGRTSEVAKIP